MGRDLEKSPSPALREKEGPTPKVWEGEGLRAGSPSPVLGYASATLSRKCGRGASHTE